MNPDNISLRDYFAGLAMQEYIGLACRVAEDGRHDLAKSLSNGIQVDAYKMADAMLAEREKGNKQV